MNSRMEDLDWMPEPGNPDDEVAVKADDILFLKFKNRIVNFLLWVGPLDDTDANIEAVRRAKTEQEVELILQEHDRKHNPTVPARIVIWHPSHF